MDYRATGLFLVAAIGILGSPGPAIAALLAVGKAEGLKVGLRFFLGLQVGLAIAAGASTLGLTALLQTFPDALRWMSIGATIYLIYLAWRIATSPVGTTGDESCDPKLAAPALYGVVLGLSNPKAYVAFASLLAGYVLVAGHPGADGLLKWVLLLAVMIAVDILWLLAGVALGQAVLPSRIERALNYGLATMILAASVLTLS